ncbi:MAG: EthD domain-containing protein [Gammaproteobacteria bacterium]|jgi:hypothetical protein
MIRLLTCLKRRPDVSLEEFREYWHDERFDALIGQFAEFTRAERYAKNLTLTVEANQLMMQDRGLAEPFDGILEYWWHDAHNFEAMYNSERRQILTVDMQDFQANFVDFHSSVSFFTESD